MGGKRLTGKEFFGAKADTGIPGPPCRHSEKNRSGHRMRLSESFLNKISKSRGIALSNEGERGKNISGQWNH
jgi:hypothetical protein